MATGEEDRSAVVVTTSDRTGSGMNEYSLTAIGLPGWGDSCFFGFVNSGPGVVISSPPAFVAHYPGCAQEQASVACAHPTQGTPNLRKHS